MILFIVFVLIFDYLRFATRACGALDLEFFQQHPLFVAHAAALEQFRPPQPGAAQRLLQSPAPDRRMIARHQHRGHRPPVDRRRPRVMRPIHQPVAERLLLRRFRAAQRPRQQPRNRIDHHQRRQFAARQHIVADRPLLVDLALDEALVDPLVAPRHQHQSRPSARLARHGLLEPAPVGAQVHPPAARPAAPPPPRASALRSGSTFSTMPGPPP